MEKSDVALELFTLKIDKLAFRFSQPIKYIK